MSLLGDERCASTIGNVCNVCVLLVLTVAWPELKGENLILMELSVDMQIF